MERHEEHAKKILDNLQITAAEQGVSQQAFHFKNQANTHVTASKGWLIATGILTVLLMLTTIALLFLHKWDYLKPTDTPEAIQLAVSKILIFTTISFLLGLSAKNYLANRHNEVINRHRQNALMTYTALVDAAGDDVNRDIVLTKAAESIFATQATGYGKADGADGKALSMLSVAPAALKHLD